MVHEWLVFALDLLRFFVNCPIENKQVGTGIP